MFFLLFQGRQFEAKPSQVRVEGETARRIFQKAEAGMRPTGARNTIGFFENGKKSAKKYCVTIGEPFDSS
jgi:hypothetical protein